MSIRFGRSGGTYSSSEVMQSEDDDWRKIEDVTERRRIQNRLAQRNYRRKLRAKLEELERKAYQTTGPAEPSPSSAERPTEPATSSAAISPNPITTPAPAPPPQNVVPESVNSIPQPAATTSLPDFDFEYGLEHFLNSADEFISPFSESTTEHANCGSMAGSVGLSSFMQPFPQTPFDSAVPMPSVVPITPEREVGTAQATRVHDFSNPTARLSFHMPGYLVPPRFSPPPLEPEEQDIARQDITALSEPSHHPRQLHTPSIVSLESSAAPPPPAPTSVKDCSEPPHPLTPSESSKSGCGSHRCIREEIMEATATLQLPPGILEFIPASEQKKYQNRVTPPSSSLTTYQPGLTLSPDHRYLTIKSGNIFHAGMLNALILSVDALHILDDDAISPFNSPKKPEHNLPPDLAPTALQKSVLHHPYIDIIPFPSFRDKLLRFADLGIINGDDMCDLMYSGWGVWGARPWDMMSWEIGDKFAEKYWFLVDKDMKRATDFWRGQRGEPPLRFHESWGRGRGVATLKRGRVLGEDDDGDEGGGRKR